MDTYYKYSRSIIYLRLLKVLELEIRLTSNKRKIVKKSFIVVALHFNSKPGFCFFFFLFFLVKARTNGSQRKFTNGSPSSINSNASILLWFKSLVLNIFTAIIYTINGFCHTNQTKCFCICQQQKTFTRLRCVLNETECADCSSFREHEYLYTVCLIAD